LAWRALVSASPSTSAAKTAYVAAVSITSTAELDADSFE
jgi:hypothetical protein